MKKKSTEKGIINMSLSTESTVSAYTEEEIQEAQRLSESIYRDLCTMGRATFVVIAQMYDFGNARMYKRLNCRTADEWVRTMGFAPSTFKKYMSIYKSLTIRLGIPKEKYETLDVNKVLSLKILAEGAEKAGLSKSKQVKLIIDHIEEAWEMDISDLINSTYEKVKELTGKNPEDESADASKRPVRSIYKVVLLTKEERNLNPNVNARNMVMVKNVSSRWWYEKKSGQFVIEVR